MHIGAIAREAGVSCDTLRFYEKLGLIRSTRAGNGYRRYAPETARLVAYIRTAQKLGFSLAEIGANMPAVWNAADPDGAVAALLAAKVHVIDERIAELQALRSDLLERVRQACPLAQGGRNAGVAGGADLV
jgi:MerR family copper efflux transcriptional regulator